MLIVENGIIRESSVWDIHGKNFETRVFKELNLAPMKLIRGRPKNQDLAQLIKLGTVSNSKLKCVFCHREFPRRKSLQTHLKTHTGEKDHCCTYPNCGRTFTQSGHLRNHERLHTQEKPFKCSADDCSIRFAHSARKCPIHPDLKLLRAEEPLPTLLERFFSRNSENRTTEETAWLQRQYEKIQGRQNRSETVTSDDSEGNETMTSLDETSCDSNGGLSQHFHCHEPSEPTAVRDRPPVPLREHVRNIQPSVLRIAPLCESVLDINKTDSSRIEETFNHNQTEEEAAKILLTLWGNVVQNSFT